MKKEERQQQGWDIFLSSQSSKDRKVCKQVQRIDEAEILKDDEEAKALAIKAGYGVGTKNNPYEVTYIPPPPFVPGFRLGFQTHKRT